MAQKLESYHFIEKIEKLPFVKRVILYGSRGRGDNRERSDIQWHSVKCIFHNLLYMDYKSRYTDTNLLKK